MYATRLTTLIPQFPKYPSLRFLISVYDSQQCQCVQNTVFDALPCVWLLARHPPVSVDPRASFQSVKIPNQISFLITRPTKLKNPRSLRIITHISTLRKTPITASPLSSITASSNKLYLSEFQWTIWSCEKKKKQIRTHANMNYN